MFVPAWGLGSPAAQKVPRSEWLAANGRQAACSVAYARSHAAEYGGDPSTLVLFGHSAGANTASVLAFNRPTPSEGCPGGDELGPISSLVTFEGDWLFMDSMWHQVIPDDPAVLSEGTPWNGLERARRPSRRDAGLGGFWGECTALPARRPARGPGDGARPGRAAGRPQGPP